MINFIHGGKNFSIRFFYENADDVNDPTPLANVTGKRIKTTCKLSTRTNDGKYDDIAIASSTNHKADLFTKDTGRKMALARALSAQVNINNQLVRIFNDKESRKYFWIQYFNNHKEGKKLLDSGKVKA